MSALLWRPKEMFVGVDKSGEEVTCKQSRHRRKVDITMKTPCFVWISYRSFEYCKAFG